MRRVAFTALVIAALPALAQPAGRQFAFLVACAQYDPTEFRPLQFTNKDILQFRDVLRASGFADDNVVVMHDQSERRYSPEAAKIVREFDLLLAAAKPADTVVVAFSGHGVQFKGERQNYFCPLDGRVSDRKTLVPLDDLYKRLDACKARKKLMLVDACRNDPASSVAKSKGVDRLESLSRPQGEPVPEGIVALFSCTAGQQSYEWPALGHGIFFHHVIEGWKGAAAVDGVVTVKSLQRYVEDNTEAYARKHVGASQTPVPRNDFNGTWVLKAAAKPAAAAFQRLFNGRDLTGWEVDGPNSGGWSVANENLVVAGTGPAEGNWLLSRRSFADFRIRFEFALMAKGANSGFCFRAQPGDRHLDAIAHAEVQVADDSQSERDPTGSLYVFNGPPNFVRPDRLASLKPLGSWNAMEVEVRGRTVKVVVNGVVVRTTEFDSLAAKGTLKAAMARASGRVGFQKWAAGQVRYRNIEILELK